MKLRDIKDLDIKSKKVFIRCDFNVPMDEYSNINDDRRIKEALTTIRYCIDLDCSIILVSHFGRPKKDFEDKYSLNPIAKRLHTLLKQEIIMAKNVIQDDTLTLAKNLKKGEILLLENLRYNIGEINNDDTFSKKLASMADIYINDAFGVSHRSHSSVDGITKYFDNNSKAAGFLLAKEINFFHKIIHEPKRPFVALIGGSKVSSKLKALHNLLPKVDKLIIGGGMAFTFLKALGYDIGSSLVENDLLDDALNIINEAKLLGVKFYLPVDVVCAQTFNNDSFAKETTIQEIPKDWMGLDIGPATSMLFSQALQDTHTILWNGPMGVYEMDKFKKGSASISHTVAS